MSYPPEEIARAFIPEVLGFLYLWLYLWLAMYMNKLLF